MAIERRFLGWNGPALPEVVRWLRGSYAQGQTWDLSSVTVVLPTGRAMRRLLELLVQAADDAVLIPPELVLPGALPERLCRVEGAVATDLQSLLVRMATLRSAEASLMARVVPRPPEPDDVVGWWTLARQVDRLAEDLAAARLRLVDAAALVEAPTRVAERLAALAALEAAHDAALAEAGLVDPQAARLQAIETGRCAADGPVVLAAMADLSPAQSAMLRCVGEGGEVVALVHAPPEHADGFDDLGGLVTDYWQAQRVPIRDGTLRFVDRPADQAEAVVAAIAADAQDSVVHVDRVTVGLGDQALAGLVKRTLDLAQLPARFGPGRPVSHSRPATLLAALGRFLERSRFDDFAQLLRHPDLEAYLAAHDGTRRTLEHWLTLLDTYASEHLQGELDGRWLGDDTRQAELRAMWDAVLALAPDDQRKPRPLPEWSEPIAAALRGVYGELRLDRHVPEDHELLQALEAIGDALREQARLPAAAPVTAFTFAEAIRVTLSRLEASRVPDEADGPAIELAGFLDLPLDDAPRLVITSMNEGSVPTSRNVDPLLPDRVRGRLGLADNARLFARDLYHLAAALHGRERVTLLACRRSAQGDPLAPSRLLLACDDAALVRRMRRFYGSDRGGEELDAAPLMLVSPGECDVFLIPPPLLPPEPIRKLPVTAFRDYLACPYRFYLRHVVGLRAIGDEATELDGLTFGGLAHEVLMAFGRGDGRGSTDADEIAQFCSHVLDDLVEERFGRRRRAALRVQVEQLRDRLAAFAKQQADWTAEGWRIVEARVERELQAVIHVDDAEFTITGRVDRIDHHPDLGYRILDYKTGDSGLIPQKTHRARRDGQLVWIDLQLPLYRDLCAPLGITGDVAVGYVNLPKKLGDVRLELAEWTEDDYAEAIAQRDEVVRAVRASIFWPPNEPPDFGDDFVRICGDGVLDRPGIIERTGRLMRAGPSPAPEHDRGEARS